MASICVAFLLFEFQRRCRLLALIEVLDAAHRFPFGGVLFLDVLIGGFARGGVKLPRPFLMIELRRILGLPQNVAVLLLFLVHVAARLSLRFAQHALLLVLARGGVRLGALRAVLDHASGLVLLLMLIGLDDVAVMRGAAILIQHRIGYAALAAEIVLAIEPIAFFVERLRLRSDVNLRVSLDALLFERARVIADIDTGAFHEFIEITAPHGPHIGCGRARRHFPAMLLGLAHVARTRRRADDLAAGVDIGVLEDDMRVGIVRVLASIMVRRAPGDAAMAELVHEASDEFVTLLLIELDRQRDHELVGDARIVRHAGFFPELVEKHPRAAAAVRHVLGLKFRHRFRAHDVADMRRRRPGLVRFGPDAGVLKGGKRFCDHGALRTNNCCCKTMAYQAFFGTNSGF